MKTITREDSVAEFNRAAGVKTHREGGDFAPQLIAFSEELEEFSEALSSYLSDPSEEARQEMIKEWADVQYTLSNFAWFFDFDGQVAFNRVHQNNLTKIGPDGSVKFREDGKIIKPEGFVSCSMEGL